MKTTNSYLTTWEELFRVFLGWSKEQTWQWAEERDWIEVDVYDIIYHDDPQVLVMGHIIGQILEKQLGDKFEHIDMLELILRVRREVDAQNDMECIIKSHDWKLYKERVNSVLEAYEANLSV